MGIFEDPLEIEEELTDAVAEKLVEAQPDPGKAVSGKKK